MGREIKFRVWNKASNYFFDLTEGDWGFYFLTPQGKFMVHYHGGMGNAEETKELDYVIVQQFTGLKDSNGKEIFEGDIVELDELDLGSYEEKTELRRNVLAGETKFPMKRVCNTILFADGGFGFKGQIIECVVQRQWDCNHYKFVVVGNVFENPQN